MPYTDLIRLEGEYNYSANIQFDVENDQKLLRFLPNASTIELFREFFVDITRPNPACHSRILYGSYGTGKSHFLTVLSLLLEKKFSEGVAYATFAQRIKEYDEPLSKDINNFISDTQKKPFLVVPIVFDFDDFDRCIYFSLKRRLDSLHIAVHYPSFYEQALELVNAWIQNDESRARLDSVCAKISYTAEELAKQLFDHDPKADVTFRKVFSGMSFGGTYVYEAQSLSETLEQAHAAIKDRYSGIVFIFDEFGRYLEDNIRNVRVKAIQNLSEYCDHNNTSTHLILVSHMEIGQYTQRYGQNMANEWKKVEGRFRSIPINDKQDQYLAMAANVIVKEPEVWNAFLQRNGEGFAKMQDSILDFHGFGSAADSALEICKRCFPLHPITLYALDRLSKKVAQNERTFFTYLASSDENSLYNTLESFSLDEFHYVGIDDIFSYFEPSIKAIQSDASYEWYRNLQGALSKLHLTSVSDSIEVRILKALTVIGVVNDYSLLPANKTTFSRAIDAPIEVIDAALDSLCTQKVLKYSGAYERYEYYNASIFDIDALLAEESRNVSVDAVVRVLNERFIRNVLYPFSYNRQYKINRVFVPVFATEGNLNQRTVNCHLGEYYDGVLVMLVADSDTSIANACMASNSIARSIFLMNKDTTNLLKQVRKLIAVDYLESQKDRYTQTDPTFEIELKYHKREINKVIATIIDRWFSLQEQIVVICNGEIVASVDNQQKLTELASSVMRSAYPSTLLVNNELVNKNTTSPTISTARKNVIRAMIKGASAESYYDQVYLSPDYIMVRSVLTKNGYTQNINGTTVNQLDDGTQPQVALYHLLEGFIKSAGQGAVQVGDMYHALKSEPFGLRDGYLSLLFAHYLLQYKRVLSISSHDIDKELTAELFEDLVKRPKEYSFSIVQWTDQQIDYLDELTQLFKDFIDEDAVQRNRLKAIYDALMKHYRSITKFARTTELYVDSVTCEYRKLLEKTSTNYARFIFSQLTKLSGVDTAGNTIATIKVTLDGAYAKMLEAVIEKLGKHLAHNCEKPLAEMLHSKYDSEWHSKRQRSFDYYTNAFLDYVSRLPLECSDTQVITDLAKQFTGFEPNYWSDTHMELFCAKFAEIVKKLDDYVPEKNTDANGIRITMSSPSMSRVVVFEETEMGTLGNTMKRKIASTLANYGQAVSYEQKIQVVLSVLSELMEGNV